MTSADSQSAEERRRSSTDRARALYARLMALPRPADLSNNAWSRKAGVNTSFFVNMRNGSEPGVGKLQDVLRVVGVTMSSFFAEDDDGRAA